MAAAQQNLAKVGKLSEAALQSLDRAACQQAVRVFERTETVMSVAFSPPGKAGEHAKLVSGGNDLTVMVWALDGEGSEGEAKPLMATLAGSHGSKRAGGHQRCVLDAEADEGKCREQGVGQDNWPAIPAPNSW